MLKQKRPPTEPKRYDDDSIPEEDLEFNPDATDLNKVFVEQPPSPQFTAATGTFKAIRLEAEGSVRPPDQLAETDERESPVEEHFDPTDTQVQVITLFPGQPTEEGERRASSGALSRILRRYSRLLLVCSRSKKTSSGTRPTRGSVSRARATSPGVSSWGLAIGPVGTP